MELGGDVKTLSRVHIMMRIAECNSVNMYESTKGPVYFMADIE